MEHPSTGTACAYGNGASGTASGTGTIFSVLPCSGTGCDDARGTVNDGVRHHHRHRRRLLPLRHHHDHLLLLRHHDILDHDRLKVNEGKKSKSPVTDI